MEDFTGLSCFGFTGCILSRGQVRPGPMLEGCLQERFCDLRGSISLKKSSSGCSVPFPWFQGSESDGCRQTHCGECPFYQLYPMGCCHYSGMSGSPFKAGQCQFGHHPG